MVLKMLQSRQNMQLEMIGKRRSIKRSLKTHLNHNSPLGIPEGSEKEARIRYKKALVQCWCDLELLHNLEISKVKFDRIVDFLTVSKSDVLPSHKERLDSYERKIIKFYEVIRPRKPESESNDNQINSQLKSMMLQGCELIIPQIKQQGQPLLLQM
ncbi:hypothetical protein QQP08_018372 [Theobroma cacao]|nr:hypothetical protein QQP08_018372 [Theobroma cacao]